MTSILPIFTVKCTKREYKRDIDTEYERWDFERSERIWNVYFGELDCVKQG